MNVMQGLLIAAAAFTAGLVVGRHNPSLAAAAAKYVATAKNRFDEAVAKAQAKLK